MTSINAMKKKLSQLEAEKAAIIAKVSETARKNADADFSLQDAPAWSIKPLAQRDVAQPG